MSGRQDRQRYICMCMFLPWSGCVADVQSAKCYSCHLSIITTAHPFFIRVGSEWKVMVVEELHRSAHSVSISRASFLSERSCDS